MAFFPRSVEWVRADVPLGNQLVDEIEHVYYSWNAPSKGGPQLTSLPPTGAAMKAPNEAAAGPQRIKPVFPRRLPGEGVWKPTGPPVQGGAPVLVTTFRPELDYPRIVAYVAWFDHTRTALAFYPGRYEPPHAAVRGPMMVPNDQRRRLLATQQRLHLLGHEQRLDRQRPHQRAAREGQRHARRLSRWPRRDRQVERRRQCRAERCLGPPEPAADHLERTTQPRPERQLAVGLHGRQRRPRLAHRRRHRSSRQPDLCSRRRPDRDHPGANTAACGGDSSDAVRHQR
jgi:hypothetical protein